MKKVIVVLLLTVNGFMIAQSKTLVTVNGEKVSFNPNGSWSTLGNAGTSSTVNYIGTTDGRDILIKKGTVRAGWIGPAYSGVSFGYGALSNDTNRNNVAFGTDALSDNVNGYGNDAVGAHALFKNTSGRFNEAIGFSALKFNVTGNNNTAIGSFALDNNVSGSYNMAFGSMAGKGIVTGSYNMIFGANVTGLSGTLSHNIIFADGEGNQRININDSGNVGIGTTNPLAKLDVQKGTSTAAIKIVDGTVNDGYVLTSDGDGVARWAFPGAPPSLHVEEGSLNNTTVYFSGPENAQAGQGSSNHITGCSIDLTPGKWIVNIGFLIGPKLGSANVAANASYGARFTLSSRHDTLTNNNAVFTFVGSNSLVFNMVTTGLTVMPYVMFADGVIRVDVRTATTLYLWNALSNEFGSALGSVVPYGSNYFYATKTD